MTIFIVAPILTYVVGSWIDAALSLSKTPPFPINLVAGPIVFVSGLYTGIKSTRVLYSVGLGLPWGEAKRMVQTSVLVKTGPYAHTRNPMILGYSLLPCGMGLMFSSPGMFLFIPAVVVAVNIFIVKVYEEPNLEERFCEEYLEYRRRTPFLIPRPVKLLRALLKSSE